MEAVLRNWALLNDGNPDRCQTRVGHDLVPDGFELAVEVCCRGWEYRRDREWELLVAV